MIQYVERRQWDGSKIHVVCPKAVDTFNTFMSGVDKGDQLRILQGTAETYEIFYKYILCFLFQVSITYPLIIYSKYLYS